ncbi:unnamed protein product [Amoebophrya sp. A120]|nr:unnamed protein product [Amoebophrya sp. A120]|eukprot:GSA120T00000093001.1
MQGARKDAGARPSRRRQATQPEHGPSLTLWTPCRMQCFECAEQRRRHPHPATQQVPPTPPQRRWTGNSEHVVGENPKGKIETNDRISNAKMSGSGRIQVCHAWPVIQKSL